MTELEAPAFPCPKCGQDTVAILDNNEEYAGADDAENPPFIHRYQCSTCGDVDPFTKMGVPLVGDDPPTT